MAFIASTGTDTRHTRFTPLLSLFTLTLHSPFML
jgi:hypothetical protein